MWPGRAALLPSATLPRTKPTRSFSSCTCGPVQSGASAKEVCMCAHSLHSMCKGCKPSKASTIKLSAVVSCFSASVCAVMEASLVSVRGCCTKELGQCTRQFEDLTTIMALTRVNQTIEHCPLAAPHIHNCEPTHATSTACGQDVGSRHLPPVVTAAADGDGR